MHKRSGEHMGLNSSFARLEAHIRALAAAAAQAQVSPAGAKRGQRGWSERYDALARNLAEPGLEELAALRRALRLEAGVRQVCSTTELVDGLGKP
jgi:hypothetical protein